MSHLKLTNTTSFSKIGAGLGIMLGGWIFNNPVLNIALGLTGSFIGNQIILSKITTEITEEDLSKQIQIVKNHFDTSNPIETNYNLYDVDPIGKLPFFNLIEYLYKNTAKQNLDNKFLSSKHFVFDYSWGTTPYDYAPLIGGAVKHYLKDSNGLTTCAEIGLIYALRPFLNYFLYQQDLLNDIESFELECNQHELKDFIEVIPEDLYIGMNRVAV
jgi:hypothetical protein